MDDDDEGDTSSIYDDDSNIMDDELMTPFAGDHINHIRGTDIKPFRNVIKRYWTEEEVSITT